MKTDQTKRTMFTLNFRLAISVCLLLSTIVTLGQSSRDELWATWNSSEIHDTLRIKALDNLAWYHYTNQKPDSAIILAQWQLELGFRLSDRGGREAEIGQQHVCLAYDTEGIVKYNNHNYREALIPLYKAYNIRIKQEDENGLVSSLRFLGAAHNDLGDFIKAEEYWLEGLDLSKKLEKQAGIASFLNNLGNLYYNTGDSPQSIERYTQSLAIYEQINDEQQIATALNNLGNMYLYHGQLSTALSYQQRALSLRNKGGNPKHIATSHNNMANAYLVLADSATAVGDTSYSESLRLRSLLHVDSALIACEHHNERKERSIALKTRALHELADKQYVAAVASTQESIDLFIELGTESSLVSRYVQLGDIHAQWAQDARATDRETTARLHDDNAIAEYERALDLAQRLTVTKGIYEASSALYHCYKKQGRSDEAMAMYELSVEQKEKLEEEESARKLLRYEMKRAYAAKVVADSIALSQEWEAKSEEQQSFIEEQGSTVSVLRKAIISFLIVTVVIMFIARYRRRVKEQRRVEEAERMRLRAIDSEMKALRAQMNPHFIFNTLQSIQSYLLQNDVDDAEEYLTRFSGLIRMVLENSKHSRVPLSVDIDILCRYMDLEKLRLNQEFEYIIDIGEGVDSETELIPPLILQPIVENAIWHGLQPKSSPGKLYIDIKAEGDVLICVLRDDGVGRHPKKKDSTQGNESLGTSITEERLMLLGGLGDNRPHMQIEDLTDTAGKPTGTLVTLMMKREVED